MIGLQSTGEAHIRQMMARQRSQAGETDESGESLMLVDGFISSPREILLQLMENAFPSIQIPDYLRSFAASLGEDDEDNDVDNKEREREREGEGGLVVERRRGWKEIKGRFVACEFPDRAAEYRVGIGEEG